MQGDLDDQETATAVARLEALLRGISLIGLSAEIKKRAMEAYPVSVKTLDALHIASALRYADRFPDEQVLVFSHDAAFNRCARALGFNVPLWDSEEHQQEAEI
jgi:hypothetical protein